MVGRITERPILPLGSSVLRVTMLGLLDLLEEPIEMRVALLPSTLGLQLLEEGAADIGSDRSVRTRDDAARPIRSPRSVLGLSRPYADTLYLHCPACARGRVRSWLAGIMRTKGERDRVMGSGMGTG